jgi:hypothetical protein
MTIARKSDVDFWGLIVVSYVADNIYVQVISTVLALIVLFMSFKERSEQSQTNLGNSGCGESCGVHGSCEQSCKSGQSGDSAKASKVSCG